MLEFFRLMTGEVRVGEAFVDIFFVGFGHRRSPQAKAAFLYEPEA
jgi:hypothetical protein